jgi:hypothetical protein
VVVRRAFPGWRRARWQWGAGPAGGVDDDQAGSAGGCVLGATVAGGAEDAAGVVAAAVVAAIRAEEEVMAGAAVGAPARAGDRSLSLGLTFDQIGEKRR